MPDSLLQRIGTFLSKGRAAPVSGRQNAPDHDRPVSFAPEILTPGSCDGDADGWHDASAAGWQHEAYAELLRDMYRGDVRVDLQAAADAVRDTRLDRPTLLEVGCGSGYYSEVLAHLCGGEVEYSGLDYSEAMIALATKTYPETPFFVGDAADLTFADNAYDIVMNGATLMHMQSYEQAIAESRRVARSWCIYHTIPTVTQRPTTTLSKHAYGAPVVEITFNRSEFERLLAQNSLIVRKIYASVPHEYLNEIMGEEVHTYTYLCKTEKS